MVGISNGEYRKFENNTSPLRLASHLKVGDKSATLRNDRGVPVWLKGEPGNRPVK